MEKCPYCFEDLKTSPADKRCPYCDLSMEKTINLDYPSVDRKRCIYCGKSVAKEAKYCRYCHKWIEDVERMAKLLEELE